MKTRNPLRRVRKRHMCRLRAHTYTVIVVVTLIVGSESRARTSGSRDAHKQTRKRPYVHGYRRRFCSPPLKFIDARISEVLAIRTYSTCTVRSHYARVYRYYVGRNDEVSMIALFRVFFHLLSCRTGDRARGRKAGYTEAARRDIARRSSEDLSRRIFIIIP